ncbi:MAG: glutamine-hydrolyzing carbamoyl-phosphate synthase small subunit [Candidatus Omnitrophota bacterium]|nr:glutamine-hydrolyzing carbamoyl-phosphate synthase small subunit [Candidatus Omnitrophota bacterium]
MKAILMLEDGKSFLAEALSPCPERIGEVIFNTAVVGYQEMITDPASAGKILVFTYPLIGNYGCAPKFNESGRAWVSAAVIKESSRIYSNWQAKYAFEDFIKKQNLPLLSGVDTRTLTLHLRQKGQMQGVISTTNFDQQRLLAGIKSFKKEKMLPEISVKTIVETGKKKAKHKIAILDLGITNSLKKQLESLGASVILCPYDTPAEEVLRLKPQGLVISGGPEADPALKIVEENLKRLIDRLPILGVSCGHLLLAASLGARIVKMKLGHHGVNYPICSPTSYKGEITVQNHSYAVDNSSVSKIKNVKITAINLNDRSVESIESKKLKFIGIQYYPVSPGFNEVNPILTRFIRMIKK